MSLPAKPTVWLALMLPPYCAAMSATANPTMDSYPTHTPELLRLCNAMNTANAAVKRIARKPNPFHSPEYATAKAAHRAYWAAVDADADATAARNATATVQA